MRRSYIGKGMLACVLLSALVAAGCENAGPTAPPPDTYDPRWQGAQQEGGGIFGSGVTLFGDEEEGAASAGIGVNAFLWRASLDTISFMPLLSADPFGGVIITDWYAPPETPDERFKMTVYILTRTLRSDGVQVSVFRQERGADGLWEDGPTNPDTAISLEDKILDRAREIRTASLP
ncbi:MAG: DUF3576 domain-containing protein [Rhodospirillales bacterium]|nr:DUF3576 domain-containing protein [Rhodospirillales bacterium]